MLYAAVITACFAGWCTPITSEQRWPTSLACHQAMIAYVEAFTDTFPQLGIRDMQCHLRVTPEMLMANSQQLSSAPPKPRTKPARP